MSKDNWRMAVAAVALAAPLAAFGVMRAVPAWDPLLMNSSFHFYVVSFTAMGAAIACGVVIASAQTLRETRLLFLGMAFFSIAGIFAVHGLTTPGIITDQYNVSLSFSAWFSAALGCALVAASVMKLPMSLEELIERRGVTVFAMAGSLITGYILLSLTPATEGWLDWVPIDNRALQFSVGFAALSLVAFAAWRYYQAYQFARLPSQLAMVGALVLLFEVQTMLIWGQTWHLSWWLYHGSYAAAIAVLFAGWAVEVKRAGTLRAIADALSMRDALAQLNRGLDQPILDLVDAIEIKDEETFGHVRRVSAHALAIGRRLELPPDELRKLVVAAEMHDVGKISVPAAVLMKEGPLTDEEFAIIKEHTNRGLEIASQVRALKDLAFVIGCHHERIDGSGYPNGLKGDDIPLLSRIIAVADTYDAMTSQRPYRGPRSHLEAMGELLRESGRTLDPRCVQAFVQVFAKPGSPEEQHEMAAAA
jgi:HD-GYP domain-containing protein (c-di-GMP phosphodiesterase class II)